MRALLLVALAAATARAEDVKLKEVLSETEVAVLVDLGPTPTQKALYPVPDAPGGKHCDPYSFFAWRVRVLKVIAPAKDAPIAPGQELTIVPADISMLVELSHDYCEDGTDKMPIYRRFRGADAHKPGARLIALVRWQPGYGWVEVVTGSWLTAKQAAQARKARAQSYLLDNERSKIGVCLSDADCSFAAMYCDPCCPGAAQPVAASRDAQVRAEARCAARRSVKARLDCPACPPIPPPPTKPQQAACVSLRCVPR